MQRGKLSFCLRASLLVALTFLLGTQRATAQAEPDRPARVRLAAAGGVVNGYEYQPPIPLPAIGVTLHLKYGQTGIGLMRATHRAGTRGWLGGDVLLWRYRDISFVDLGDGLKRQEKLETLTYLGPVYEREIARSDTLGWRICVSASAGIAVKQLHLINEWTGFDGARTRRVVAAAVGGSLQRRLGTHWGLLIAGGAVFSDRFTDAAPTPFHVDELGLRQVYAIGGLYRELH